MQDAPSLLQAWQFTQRSMRLTPYAGARLGKRVAAQDHNRVVALLREAGKDGAELEKNLRRLLPMKTKTEYEPDDIATSAASKAVERARRCVETARRVATAQGSG